MHNFCLVRIFGERNPKGWNSNVGYWRESWCSSTSRNDWSWGLIQLRFRRWMVKVNDYSHCTSDSDISAMTRKWMVAYYFTTFARKWQLITEISAMRRLYTPVRYCRLLRLVLYEKKAKTGISYSINREHID